ncbi:retrovirus-related pol polyprotein line-1 [Plakobranchus ocellatus]|uniref:Retrovirus-related pol polyprotein line-1 n=1 Tax=Plakobranchus ocellatus TaxID=259542 RepID=A0AAV4BIQ6_9GAST|nr:retrovirus-related pol polyprotein line-1 [Plakobranchus ocellatus]
MGYFNTKVGDKRVEDVVGPSGIGTVNKRGGRPIDANDLSDASIFVEADGSVLFRLIPLCGKAAFDKVRHVELFRMLEKLDIDEKDLRVIKNLYWDQTESVRIEGENSDFKPIKRGLRQGCVMSPDLFNLYSEIILRTLDSISGLKINGENLNNLRYADDNSRIWRTTPKTSRYCNFRERKNEPGFECKENGMYGNLKEIL